MALHHLAGKPAPPEILIDPAKLEREYYSKRPDLDNPRQLVSFGTSGHRGTPLDGSFTEAHILAIAQAICDYRRANQMSGPLFMGMDTHALSAPAQRTALEVLAANSVETIIQAGDDFTPPSISHAILAYNRSGRAQEADGIVITPSHNPRTGVLSTPRRMAFLFPHRVRLTPSLRWFLHRKRAVETFYPSCLH